MNKTLSNREKKWSVHEINQNEIFRYGILSK